MRRMSVELSRFTGVVAAVLLAATAVMAQGTKSASGTIAAIGPSSVTVTVDGKDMVFNVDGKTNITTPGGSTKARAAKAEGKEGARLAELLKVGQGVRVEYHEEGMHAATIRTLPSPPRPSTGAAAPAARNASGVVTAVSGTSLAIKAASGELTFVVDENTDVIATGAGTASRAKQAEGKKTVITDFVAVGDTVAVNYREAAGANNARTVRVTKKGGK